MTALNHESTVQESIRYLNSDEAKQSLDTDVYWPKWNAPWWNMAVLHEMGLAQKIPRATARHMAERLRTQLVPFFFSKDVPEGRDPLSDTPCPCALGNIYQILSAAGVDMDQELPWAREWFLKYQMPDGGLSCDEDAYKSNPPASSIVGTIAPLEAILFYTRRSFTPDEVQFLDRGANCLIQRKLMLGCSAEYNAEERLDQEDWLKPCFPRFYLYDVLRGLNFILNWSGKRRQLVPLSSITPIMESLSKRFPDGQVRIERQSFEGVGTRIKNSSGEWARQPNAFFFPLLDQVSRIGDISPYLTRQWTESLELLERLKRDGLVR